MNDGGKNKDCFFEIPEDSVASELMYIRAITAHKDLWQPYYNFQAIDVKDNWDQSHCMFNLNLKRGANVTHGNVKGEFIELKYKPQKYYLFNAQVAHTVYNFKDTRYLFSVDFEEDRTKLTYNQLLAEMRRERWWEK